MTYNNKSYVVKYKYILLKNNIVLEPSIKYTINKYGHTKEFIKLSKKQKEEIHRVVSPLACKLIGVEENYAVRDINGNGIVFEIFLDGNYRIIKIEKIKDIVKEVINETNINRNS